MNILVVDVGGSKVKVAIGAGYTGKPDSIGSFDSGKDLTPKAMLKQLSRLTDGHQIDCVTIGVPAVCSYDTILTSPVNLGKGWAGFNFKSEFEQEVRVINDAAMQALGFIPSLMTFDPVPPRVLFLGLGTGLGSAIIQSTQDGFGGAVVLPLETGHMPYKNGKSFEDYVGKAALERMGKKKWKKHVMQVIDILSDGFLADKVLLGGGNAELFDELPENVVKGNNEMAFVGGCYLRFNHSHFGL